VSSVKFLTTKTEVLDGSRVGYLMVTVTLATAVDLEELADESGGVFWILADTCETHIPLMVSGYPYPAGKGSYTVPIAYKDIRNGSYGSYNLADRPEDICMRVGIGSMNPFDNPRRKIRYTLPDNLKNALHVYDAESGLVDFTLTSYCWLHSARCWRTQTDK
jgi:hypothetical protein